MILKRCEFCPKTFNSSFYLDSHLNRRHGDKISQRVSRENREPLKVDKSNNQDVTINEIHKITDTVEKFASRIVETERQFREQMEEKMEQKMNMEVQRRQVCLFLINLVEHARRSL